MASVLYVGYANASTSAYATEEVVLLMARDLDQEDRGSFEPLRPSHVRSSLFAPLTFVRAVNATSPKGSALNDPLR
ncbi:hypothetical protein COLO4_34410 [Corchorus olitorius]|uniref:Uncharacterized protein n=1 Tax=Corchorus olitorius TaxID=93759 RepID=A0A1R3GKW2_9ROSI|nr:hypothetical protein COLO4_34410 [Corchorus olitorius]